MNSHQTRRHTTNFRKYFKIIVRVFASFLRNFFSRRNVLTRRSACTARSFPPRDGAHGAAHAHRNHAFFPRKNAFFLSTAGASPPARRDESAQRSARRRSSRDIAARFFSRAPIDGKRRRAIRGASARRASHAPRNRAALDARMRRPTRTRSHPSATSRKAEARRAAKPQANRRRAREKTISTYDDRPARSARTRRMYAMLSRAMCSGPGR